MRNLSLSTALAFGVVTTLLLASPAHALSLTFANGNPGDWADTFGSPLTITTSATGGATGGGMTTLPNTENFLDAGPTTQFGYTYFDTSSLASLSQSIAVYLDPANVNFQSGQFMLDEAPNATVYNSYGGGTPTPTLWGAEEDIIATGTANGITLSGSTGFSSNGQTFQSLGTVTSAGWYDFQMNWTRGTLPSDPVTTTLSVLDIATSSDVGTLTHPDYSGLNGGEGDLYQSQYLAGPGYMWFTYWNAGFSGGQLQVSNVVVDGQPAPEPGSAPLLAVGVGALLLVGALRANGA